MPSTRVIRKRVSKPLMASSLEPLNVAELARYREHCIDKQPGQAVRYVVVDDEVRQKPERVRLYFELIDEYDSAFYAELPMRACASIVSPMGRNRLQTALLNPQTAASCRHMLGPE